MVKWRCAVRQAVRRVRIAPACLARASLPSLATFCVPREQADAIYGALAGVPSMRLVENNLSARAAAQKAVVRCRRAMVCAAGAGCARGSLMIAFAMAALHGASRQHGSYQTLMPSKPSALAAAT